MISTTPLWNAPMQERTKLLLDWASRNRAVVWGSLAVPPLYFAWSWMVNDYREWRNLGPGGLPYNIGGWLLQWMIQLIFAKNDTTGLSCYDQPNKTALSKDEEAKNQCNYVGTLPRRSGPKARAAPWVIPQRQLDFQPDPAVVEQQVRNFNTLASNNTHLITVKTSVLEAHSEAIFLLPSISPPAIAKKSKSEVAHIHVTGDATSHVVLSYADCKEVIRKGWGERHRLSGNILPLGYTLLYSPRNEIEVEVMTRIFKASIKFMTGGLDVA